MKKCKYITIARHEMWVNKKIILFNLIIALLLFSITFALVELARYIPKELEKEIEDTYVGSIQVDNLNLEDVKLMEGDPVKVYNYAPDIYLQYMSITDEKVKKYIEDGKFFRGSMSKWLNNKRDVDVVEMNNRIIQGEKWEESDNSTSVDYPMWICQTFAKDLNMKVGDELHYDCKETGKKGTFYIKGIYKNIKDDSEFYIPIQTFDVLSNPIGDTIYTNVQPIHGKDYSKLVHQYREKNYIVYTYEDEIKSMVWLMYLLYVMSIILLGTMVSIIGNFLRVYFEKRKSFFGIYKAMGMSSFHIKVVHYIIAQGMIVWGAIIGFFVGQNVYEYILKYIKDLIDIGNIHKKISVPTVIIVVAFVNAILLYELYKTNKNIDKLSITDVIKDK